MQLVRNAYAVSPYPPMERVRDGNPSCLLVTYGLRTDKVVRFTLDDIDRKRDSLHISDRKVDNSAACYGCLRSLECSRSG